MIDFGFETRPSADDHDVDHDDHLRPMTSASTCTHSTGSRGQSRAVPMDGAGAGS